MYDWNGPNGATSFGLTYVYPNGHSARTKPVYEKIEELADDGSSTSGWITARGTRISFEIE